MAEKSQDETLTQSPKKHISNGLALKAIRDIHPEASKQPLYSARPHDQQQRTSKRHQESSQTGSRTRSTPDSPRRQYGNNSPRSTSHSPQRQNRDTRSTPRSPQRQKDDSPMYSARRASSSNKYSKKNQAEHGSSQSVPSSPVTKSEYAPNQDRSAQSTGKKHNKRRQRRNQDHSKAKQSLNEKLASTSAPRGHEVEEKKKQDHQKPSSSSQDQKWDEQSPKRTVSPKEMNGSSPKKQNESSSTPSTPSRANQKQTPNKRKNKDKIHDNKSQEVSSSQSSAHANHIQTVEIGQTMSEEAIEMMAERIFKEADKDGSGILTRNRIQKTIKKYGQLRDFFAERPHLEPVFHSNRQR